MRLCGRLRGRAGRGQRVDVERLQPPPHQSYEHQCLARTELLLTGYSRRRCTLTGGSGLLWQMIDNIQLEMIFTHDMSNYSINKDRISK